MNHFHSGNEKIDTILEAVMSLMEKEGKKDGKNIMHSAAEECKTFIHSFRKSVEIKLIFDYL